MPRKLKYHLFRSAHSRLHHLPRVPPRQSEDAAPYVAQSVFLHSDKECSLQSPRYSACSLPTQIWVRPGSCSISLPGPFLLVPFIEAFATLLSEFSFTYQSPQNLGRPKSLRLQRAMQILGDVQTYIKPDQIRQPQRSHGVVVTQFHRCVDVARAGDALLKHAHGLEPEGHAQATRSKTGH